ncbi:MAG: 3'(2'),5'-bisphosphate nucleotidase CysQ [Ilumatobacteraceae bacterium]
MYTDSELAAHLASETGKRLVSLRQKLSDEGASPWYVMDAGDAIAHRFLLNQLEEFRPNDAVLSEEGADNPDRLSADRVWIIDPLDGSNEFGELGRDDWAVHVALWQRTNLSGGELVAGAVALPAYDLTLSTADPPPMPPQHEGNPRLVVSRNRASREVVLVAQALGCEVARLGSAGAKAMAVVLGETDIYVHAGGQHQWDSAAPIAVARATGLHTSRIDGSPLIYNERDTWLPDLVVCQPHLAERVLTALREGRIDA